MSERLAAALDRARYVEYDPNGFVLAFFGGHGLHIYDLDGSEIDYLSIGDFSNNDASDEDVRAAMRRYRAVAAGANDEDELCPDCSGTRSTPDIYGDSELCRTCSEPPHDPFTVG